MTEKEYETVRFKQWVNAEENSGFITMSGRLVYENKTDEVVVEAFFSHNLYLVKKENLVGDSK